MNRVLTPPLLVKLFIPLIMVPFLGISPRPHAVDQALQAAQFTYAQGSPLDASKKILQALEYSPWRADFWELAGSYAFHGDDNEAAIAYFHRAAELDGLTPSGYIKMGDSALLIGEMDTAIEAYETAIYFGGSPTDLYSRLLQLHRIQGDFDATNADLRALITLQPNDAQYHYQLGLLLVPEQPELALAYLTRAAELDPSLSHPVKTIERAISSARIEEDLSYSLLNAGRALAELGEWEPATEAFNHATQIHPDYAEAWAFLGEALQHIDQGISKNGENQTGYQELRKALALDPYSIAANTFIALYWQRQERFDLALVYFHAAADLDPRNPTIQAELGNTLANMGDLNKALTYYERATELAPIDPNQWRLLAIFSIKYELQVREIALPAARQAVLLNPKDPASLDVMAQVFTILDDPLSAQRFLVRALQADPSYAPARLHLGFLHLMKGHNSDAYQQLSLAASLAPAGTPTEEQAKRLLQRFFP